MDKINDIKQQLINQAELKMWAIAEYNGDSLGIRAMKLHEFTTELDKLIKTFCGK